MNDLPLLKSINTLNDSIKSIMGHIGGIINYITHPILIWHSFVGASYWIILFICVGGIILYIFGNKKGMRYSTISIGVFALIQAFNSAIG